MPDDRKLYRLVTLLSTAQLFRFVPTWSHGLIQGQKRQKKLSSESISSPPLQATQCGSLLSSILVVDQFGWSSSKQKIDVET